MAKCLIRISMRGTWFLHLREPGNESFRKGPGGVVERVRGRGRRLERKKTEPGTERGSERWLEGRSGVERSEERFVGGGEES